MLNKMKARLLIGLGGLAVTSFMVMMGYTIGSQSVTNHTQKQIQSEVQKLLTKEKEKEKASVLSDELVKEFLTQYYTKEKLGENNNRIKPYMTDSAFKEEVARQEDSINQVYKDYMLDYRFESANIYVNAEENKAFAEVSYQVIYVSDVSDKAQKSTQTETRTLKLSSYAKLSDKLLVNQVTIWKGKLEDLKESSDEVSSSIPKIQGTTTSETN
ncbi:peptidylprolyl isomerase [Streptococcus agalactiae]|uniref:peptidylprolyl isomerase n=1 Tax=Streptococcus agalactiae TaxID=1311 RepID=UPI0024155BFD|nr:peptidylprolyl isomerase [Streptococcus agalactiae]